MINNSVATFNKPHNYSKSKVLLILYDAQRKNLGGLTYREIHLESGVSIAYVAARLSVWFRQKYINRMAVNNKKGNPYYIYYLPDRGRKFILERIPQEIRDEIIEEIREWRSRGQTQDG